MNTVKLAIEAPVMEKEANIHAQTQYAILFPLFDWLKPEERGS